MRLEEDERRLTAIEIITVGLCIGWYAIKSLWKARKLLNNKPISDAEHAELLRRIDAVAKEWL